VLDLAEEHLLLAVETGRRLEGDDGRLYLARFLNNLGTVYNDLGDLASAADVFAESLAIRTEVEGERDEVVAITLSNLGFAQAGSGDLEAAEATYGRAVELGEDLYGPDHPRTSVAYSGLGRVYYRTGRFEEAESLSRAALAIRVATSGGNWLVAGERLKLAEVLEAMGRSEEAVDELRRAWDGLVDEGEQEHARGAEVAASLGRLLVSLGREDEARVWADRAGSE
jgi:tetratricopeptide (TPR) repeat protein